MVLSSNVSLFDPFFVTTHATISTNVVKITKLSKEVV